MTEFQVWSFCVDVLILILFSHMLFTVFFYMMPNHLILASVVWALDTETECWSLIEAKGDIPVSTN